MGGIGELKGTVVVIDGGVDVSRAGTGGIDGTVISKGTGSAGVSDSRIVLISIAVGRGTGTTGTGDSKGAGCRWAG